ncbi:MAG: hypothetical protein M1825_000643 [Sarcosagium campestre]|nr:MAG: hypothetical protein M1825_000643 [Sarcosagium campestre]
MTVSRKERPLTRRGVQEAHERIKPHIHRTPVLTSSTLNRLASTPQDAKLLKGTKFSDSPPAAPKLNLFFKCENYQRVGAFKVRGAFHALSHLTEEQLQHGVVTHSSGNHAQALALAARSRGIKAYVVMPSISPPSKIAATRGYGAEVIFSGSTSSEREAVVADVISRTSAVLVPPYDHRDIILGQGTMALELEQQVHDLLSSPTTNHERTNGVDNNDDADKQSTKTDLDVVIAPLGGGGMLSGIATALSTKRTRVFGAEPSFEGGDDGRRGLASGARITSVRTLTIADGLRTPVGELPWRVISDPEKVAGVYAVSEEQIKSALLLVLERMKLVVEPSAVVGLAVVLHDEGFRRLLAAENEKMGGRALNVGVVLSGGNTTLEALGKIFAEGRAGEAG